MMQSATGMVPPPMAPIPMDQQHPAQHWPPVMHPQYHQQMAPPPMWNQQPSQVPPPQSIPPPQPQQVQMAPSQPQPMQQSVQYHQVAAASATLAPTAATLQPPSADEIRTLWVGDLQYWMDETYLHSCFASIGEVASVKVIRNRQTGQSEGYGFLEFTSRAAADRVLQTFNGQLMPNSEQTFRLNWASYGAGEKRSDEDHTIFVGDLASDVTDYMLQEIFRSRYPSVKGAKVVTDRMTGRSKGYGFVRFADVIEQNRALTEMSGVFLSTRPMRVGAATMKKTSNTASFPATQTTQSENDPNNTTIFVGGLDSSVSDDVLRQVFGQYGELVHVKIPVGKRCGFVQFATRACAEEALLMLNGVQLGGQNIRLSWGRSPANKQPQQDASQWSGNYYGYGQGYDAAAYGYAPPPQDPNMYAYGGYPGYGNYPQQQQQYPQQQ